MTTNLTLKNVNQDDKDFLANLAAENEITMPAAFSVLVNLAKKPENPEEIERAKVEISAMKAENSALQAEIEKLKQSLAELENRAPEVIEKIVEKPVELTGFQFICELDEKTSRNARKIRPFVKKEGYYEAQPGETPAEYINTLVNLSVRYFMKRNFIDYID